MRFYKTISVLLHPMVIPTIGVLVYFFLLPTRLFKEQQWAILGIVFICTYLIPLFLLLVLKVLGRIDNFYLNSIKERRFPVLFMIALYYVLASILLSTGYLNNLSTLFFATSFALLISYILFIAKLKTSLHLLSMGVATGFFLVLTINYAVNLIPVILICILLSGLLASARLHLKAHSPKEVYIGFFLGIISPLITHWIL